MPCAEQDHAAIIRDDRPHEHELLAFQVLRLLNLLEMQECHTAATRMHRLEQSWYWNISNYQLRPMGTFAGPHSALAEPHRIVAEAEELMALRDRLQASLDQSTAIRGRLLDALLDVTLKTSNRREVAAA